MTDVTDDDLSHDDLSHAVTLLLSELPDIRYLPDDDPRRAAWLERKRDLLAGIEAEQQPADREPGL